MTIRNYAADHLLAMGYFGTPIRKVTGVIVL